MSNYVEETTKLQKENWKMDFKVDLQVSVEDDTV